jgi:predicted metal-dependent HD superfamily phosphohydrolase
MDYGNRLYRTEQFVDGLFVKYRDPRLTYHNLAHTFEVVRRAREIGVFYGLQEEDMFVLQTAAWFHDTGQLIRQGRGHERRSVNLLHEHASDLYLTKALLERISKVILTTAQSVEPVTLLEKIIRDADTYHFGTPLFRQTDALVRKEIELFSGKVLTNWFASAIEMLNHHRYYTDYCVDKLSRGKAENIAWLKAQ